MSLPKRKYYNINDAASLLSCSVNDILHFGSVSIVDIYAYIKHKNNTNDFHFQINMPQYAIELIDFDSLCFDDWIATDVHFMERTPLLPVNGYYAKGVDGIFLMDRDYLKEMEFSHDKTVGIIFFSDLNYLKHEFPIEFNVLDFEINICIDSLCIKHEDLEALKNMHIPQPDESDKTLAKKENLIRALLDLIPELSGVDVDSISVKRLKEIIEATAATRGVDFPKTDLGTWSKYLERGRHKK